MSGGERVIEHLDAGYGCAEAMVVAYSDVVGMPRSLCRVATPFGGGMGRTGKTCGLVSAAVMVLGWVFGRDDAHDLSEKERAYRIVSEFIRDVEAACGASLCAAILGADLTTEAGRRAGLMEEGKLRCRVAAQRIARLLEAHLGRAESGRLGTGCPATVDSEVEDDGD